MATPYLEYTDKDGVKSKLEFSESMTSKEFMDFYTNYIKRHDPFYPPED
tara:strand:- start:67 stop:213 length:147 start_codon:yes stop_codon:yes gene_type:complete